MTRDEAIVIVVRAGNEGQKELLKALFEEMHIGELEAILEENGYVPEED